MDSPSLQDLNATYRGWLHRLHPDKASVGNAADIPADTTVVSLAREKKSHHGIGAHLQLEKLEAIAPDQSFLDEIAKLERLTHLELGWPVTAADLTPLLALKRLQVLKIDSPRNVTDFTVLARLPALRHLELSNARHLQALDWLKPLLGTLKVLGIEGSMYTAQTVASLKPLAGAALEALFLTNVKLADQDLRPLASMPSLRYLGCGIIAPRDQFMALHTALPDLQCQWFDVMNWQNFRDPRPPK